MKYMDKSIEELHKMLKNNEVSCEELIEESKRLAHVIQDKCNAFITINDEVKPLEITDELLSGIPYGVKDNFSTKGILSTGASNTLRDYVPFFSATAIEKLDKKGALKIGKTNMDEFGMGGTGTTGFTGKTLNPWDLSRMCAGSSSGSACAVAAGVFPYALGTDTGDSIRKPAAYCGIVGYKPTYGMISRYGIFPFASSLDHAGVLTRSVKDAAIVVDAMKGKDPKDMTTWDSNSINLYNSISNDVTNKKVCFIKEICDLDSYSSDISSELKEHLINFNQKLELFKEMGVQVEEVSVDKNLLNAVFSTYTVISCAEATSNMSNLTGIVFGPREKGDSYEEIMKNYRTNNFSSMIKRRFIIGAYVLEEKNKDRYFYNACRARRLLVDTWNKLFEEYDAVILPVGLGPAKKFEKDNEIIDDFQILDEHLQIGNFGGFPSITIPDGFVNDLPVGLNITGKRYDDVTVLNLAYSLESKMPYKNQIARRVYDE